MRTVRVTFLLLLLFCIIQCNGLLRFANYIQDHMVLQQAPQKAIVWGFGDLSTLTTLRVNDRIYTTISHTEPTNVQNESIWSVTLDPVSEEGPFDIYVSQALANGALVTITLHDVLFGDVWICSGQSNMELTVNMIYNGTEEIANAGNYPKIRLFTAAPEKSEIPIEELLGMKLNWSVASPDSVGGSNWTYMSAVCWLYGRMIHEALGGRPIGLIATTRSGTAIQYWMPLTALEDCNTTIGDGLSIPLYDESSVSLQLNHSNLFNAMIHPFTRMVIYGVIWYQGEANSGGHTNTYTCLFSQLIQHWRKIWNERTNGKTHIQFPFGFVQLSTWTNDTTRVGGFPWIRWHQTLDVGYAPNNVLPNLFMAVSLDLRDDPNGIHPRYKHDVGYRLSRSGLAVAYGQQVEFQGPLVQNISYVSGGPIVNITYQTVSSIEIRNSNGFEVCCRGNICLNDTLWVPAPVSSKNGLTITLTVDSSCVGQELYGLRYLWRETPCPFKQAAIYSSTDSNLPSPPYFKSF